MATARKTHTLAAARASGCRACCSRTTKTAWCKRRSKRPSTSCFLLVKTALNIFCPIMFWAIATFCHRQMGQNLIFHRVFVRHFVHERSVYLGLQHKDINSAQYVERLKVKTTSFTYFELLWWLHHCCPPCNKCKASVSSQLCLALLLSSFHY